MFDNLASNYKYDYVWDDNTIYLYFALVLFTYIISSIKIINSRYCQIKGHYYLNHKRSYIGVTISFLLLWIFAIIRDVGYDLPMYRNIYNNAFTDEITSQDLEPGYICLNQAINILGFSEFWGIGIISFLSYFLVYKAIYDNRTKISVGLSVLAFTGLYYFQSYNLVRIYLTAAFLLYTSKYLFNFKYKKYAICIIIATAFHYSASAMLIPLGLFYIYKNKKSWFYPLLIISFFVLFFMTSILSNLPTFSRYEKYLSAGIQDNAIGMMHFVINVPILLLYFYVRQKNYKSSYIDVLWVYGLMSLIFGILGYRIVMLGRILIYFNIIFIISIPYTINCLKKHNDIFYYLIYGCYAVYIFLRFYIYLSTYLVLDAIMPYKIIEI